MPEITIALHERVESYIKDLQRQLEDAEASNAELQVCIDNRQQARVNVGSCAHGTRPLSLSLSLVLLSCSLSSVSLSSPESTCVIQEPFQSPPCVQRMVAEGSKCGSYLRVIP